MHLNARHDLPYDVMATYVDNAKLLVICNQPANCRPHLIEHEPHTYRFDFGFLRPCEGATDGPSGSQQRPRQGGGRNNRGSPPTTEWPWQRNCSRPVETQEDLAITPNLGVRVEAVFNVRRTRSLTGNDQELRRGQD